MSLGDRYSVVRNDLAGSESMDVPDSPPLESLPTISGKIDMSCEYSVWIKDGDAERVESPKLSQQGRVACEKILVSELTAKGLVITREAAARPEKWVFRIEQTRFERNGSLINDLFPPQHSTMWISLARFRPKESDPYSFKTIDGESEFRMGNAQLSTNHPKVEGSFLELMLRSIVAQAILNGPE